MKTKTITYVMLMLSVAILVVCDNSSEVKSTCIKDLDINEDELTNFFDRGMKLADATDNVKCFLKCYFELEGYMKDGVLLETPSIEAFRQVDGNPNGQQIYNDCKNVLGVDDCDTAFKIMMCWENHDLNLHI